MPKPRQLICALFLLFSFNSLSSQTQLTIIGSTTGGFNLGDGNEICVFCYINTLSGKATLPGTVDVNMNEPFQTIHSNQFLT